MSRSILHVAQPFDAGVPRVAAALMEDQAGRGWRVTAASPPGGDLERRARDLGVPWVAWEADRSPGPRTAAEVRHLARIVDEIDPEVLHLHSAKAGLAGRLAVRSRRATIFEPNAWSFEAADGALKRAVVAWERFATRWTDVVVCVSEGERSLGIEAGIKTDFQVLPNSVDLRRFPRPAAGARDAARARLGLDDGPLALCLGRLSPQKNQGALLDVWPRVRALVPGARLALVGEGPDRDELAARAVEGVDVAGPTDEAPTWLAAATLVVQPSRWEGMSLALLEALAAARSVVVTDVSGMRDVVVDGVGAVVAPGDLDALADAIVERLANPALADLEGEAGRARAEESFDLPIRGARMVEVYERALAARRRPS